MGYYINPKGMSKEEWLKTHACNAPDAINVCLVDNGPFTAAGIAFNKQELAVFKREDGRAKQWFKISRDDIISVCPEVEAVLE